MGRMELGSWARRYFSGGMREVLNMEKEIFVNRLSNNFQCFIFKLQISFFH